MRGAAGVDRIDEKANELSFEFQTFYVQLVIV